MGASDVSYGCVFQKEDEEGVTGALHKSLPGLAGGVCVGQGALLRRAEECSGVPWFPNLAAKLTRDL